MTPARIHARVTAEPLSADALCALVADDGAGATVTFQGTTRTVDRLEYEAYAEMAEPLMRDILAGVASRHDVLALAAEHRIGTVPRREASIVIAASSAHRGPAFAAAREAIDRIKAHVPIWKREVDVTAAGVDARWVEGTPVEPA